MGDRLWSDGRFSDIRRHNNVPTDLTVLDRRSSSNDIDLRLPAIAQNEVPRI